MTNSGWAWGGRTLAVTAARPPAPACCPRCPGSCFYWWDSMDRSTARGCGGQCLPDGGGHELPVLSEQPLPQDLPGAGAHAGQPTLVSVEVSPSQRPRLQMACPPPPSLLIMLPGLLSSVPTTISQPAVHCLPAADGEPRGAELFSVSSTVPGTEKGRDPHWLTDDLTTTTCWGDYSWGRDTMRPVQGRAARVGRSCGAWDRHSPCVWKQPAPSCEVTSSVCAAAVPSHGQWEHISTLQGCYED